jgi:hypothetical protein
MLRKQVCPGLVVVMMLMVPAVAGAVRAQAEDEITYLLDAIAASNCRFKGHGALRICKVNGETDQATGHKDRPDQQFYGLGAYPSFP